MTLPKLTSVGGYLYISPSVTFEAPKLTSVGGYLYIHSSVTLPKLTSVGGDLYINSSVTLPKLTSVGGYLYIYSDVKFNAPELYAKGFDNFKVYDGVACVIMSAKKQGDIEILSCRPARVKQQKLIGEKFFIAKKGIYTSHAVTIKAALEELAFKLGDRDVEQYRNMPRHTRKTPQDWAFVYRMVTGACQFGTKQFMESKGELKKTYTLSEILEQTKGAFGHDQFKSIVGAA